MFLIILLSILSGIALAALYAFLVMRFTSSYDREISIIFFPIPFILGASICYSFAYNQKISGALAVICTLVFFKFIMGTLGVTFSKVYERLTLPKVYKNYHYTSDYKTHNLEGETLQKASTSTLKTSWSSMINQYLWNAANYLLLTI